MYCYWKFYPERPQYFAVKQIKPPDPLEKDRIIASWANEAETLQKMNMEHKDHILRFVTAFTRPDVGSDRSCYLIFEWADGGCLEQLFRENPSPPLTADLVKKAATQIFGLAQALQVTHETAKIRHGDVKPENILRFKSTKEEVIGTLKIGDWGLAKYHPEATVLRLKKGQQTDTRFGTVMYEPPEVELGELRLLGRQYDVWSMGVVTLEIIVWLLYGYLGVQRLRLDVKGHYRESVPCYTIEKSRDGHSLRAKLQPIVEKWLDYIEEEPVCATDTALGELVGLVRSGLLIAELPPNRGETFSRIRRWEEAEPVSGFQLAVRPPTLVARSLAPLAISKLHRTRATSTEMVAALEGIVDDEDRPSEYWLKQQVVIGPMPAFVLDINPLDANPSVFQDKSGHLTAPGDISASSRHLGAQISVNGLSPGSHLTPGDPNLVSAIR